MKVSTYHITLRVSAVTLALVLLFDSGLLFPVTKELSYGTQTYLANAIGANASVQTTELNTLTAALSKQQRTLDAREAVINEREISVGLNAGPTTQSTPVSTYILSVLLFIIVVLIVLNYALDFARERRLQFIQKSEQVA